MEVVEKHAIAGVQARRIVAVLWLIVAIAICLKLLLDIVRQSFFLDGLIYASVARNLAEGSGTFWAPQFSRTLFSVFAEHPPLMMWLQSFLFRLFGDTVIVDKLFSLATFAVTLSVFAITWRRLNNTDSDVLRGIPVAMAFMIIAGRFSWGFANGLLENLLIVFTSIAILLVVSAYDQQQFRRRLGLIAGAGLLTALALMTKGPVGLFPLAAPAIYWVSFGRPTFATAVLDTIVIGAVIVLVFAILWTFEGPRGAIERYVSVQLLTSLSGERGHNGAGFAAIRTFLRVNAYPVLLTTAVLFFGRKVRRPDDEGLRRGRWQRIVFFSLIGFSASLPLLASPRVSTFYFNPSLPYFSAALAVSCVPTLWRILEALPDRIILVSQVVLAGALGLSLLFVTFQFGQRSQDASTIENAEKVASIVCSKVPCDATVSTCGSVYTDWLLHAYMQRYFRVALADPAATPGEYLLASDDCAIDAFGYQKTNVDLAEYRLFRRK
ncbi:glycosyltransferase family 39 protein [Rhizobium rhizogenes]|uniref:ArnT family glycosyltransferase n=1 Tax=Rhizobium rhizogenes TaxID=359 RepID=UPI0015736748|nr:glycosyltransferase family 39 protein [Rhizobium rhizogenes]NTF46112.1 hypothetical protein [Rhizobium rhizogenes]